MALLTVNGISKKEKDSYTVKGISFIQEPFQKIAIAGETGSGKTTLLKMIAGLVQPDAGEIKFNNKRVEGPYEKLIPGHPRIAYLSQHFELRNNYRVEEELECKNLLTHEEANTLYKICRIEHLLKRKTDQLSGGEKQRIVLTRLLTTSPKLLLLDEPFSNLDAGHKSIIKSVLQDVTEKFGITSILVSHDALDILSWADKILVMKDGQLIQQATPEIIYRQPVNEYTAGLLGAYNLISPSLGAALTGIKEINIPGKKIVVRPEHIIIENKKANAVQGVIQHIRFWGSYYTLSVLVSGELVTVKTNNEEYKSGDSVYLSLSLNVLWYV